MHHYKVKLHMVSDTIIHVDFDLSNFLVNQQYTNWIFCPFFLHTDYHIDSLSGRFYHNNGCYTQSLRK